MSSQPCLDSIRDFLIRLDLNPGRLPTLFEYKKAYREKLKLHPDKGGDTSLFQGITEAAMAVWHFLVQHQDKQTRPEADKDTALLKNFEKSNNVTYNKGSVVFDIEGSKADIWIDCLKKRVGPAVELHDKSGFKMKQEQFKIPLVTCKTKQDYGSLSVTVYPNPKSSHPKILVQGQAYLAFVTLVLPEVFKDMNTPRLALEGSNVSDHDSDTEHHSDEQSLLNKVASKNMEQAFHRMELEMVQIRNSLGAKVDAALVSLTTNRSNLDTKLYSIEGLMRDNLKKSNELVKAITDLSTNVKNSRNEINIESLDIEKLATSVSNHPSLSQLSSTLTCLRSEVAQSATLQAVQTQVQGLTDSISTLESGVRDIGQKITETNEASGKDMAQIRKNSDQSLGMFDAMKKSLDILAKQAPNRGTSVPPNPNSNTSTMPVPSPSSEPRAYKGIMFASKSALEIDTKKLKSDLGCDLKIIPTDYIYPHTDSHDPDSYLECMVNQHLAGKGCYDFAIIATGVDDITELDIVNSAPTTLTSNVADQTRTVVEVAENIIKENNIDVFIVEKPPRYDPADSDPSSMYSKLSKYSNGVLASSVGMTPRLYIVDQTTLTRSGTRARADIFKSDGLLLTTKGLNIYTSSIAKSLTECYPDMEVPKHPSPPNQAPEQGQGGGRNGGGARGGQGRRQDYRERRDRQHQDRPGYGYHGSSPYPYHSYPPPPPPPGWDRGGWEGPRQHRRRDNWDDSDRYRGGHNRGYRRY